MCPKVYHESCLGFQVPEGGAEDWLCPRHFCAVCGSNSVAWSCRFCPHSFCDDHLPETASIVGDATDDLQGTKYIICGTCQPLLEQAKERGLWKPIKRQKQVQGYD